MATQFAFGKIATDGLVLALDAADRNSYISGSTTWRDLSSNAYTGTLTSGPTFSSDNGGAIIFDGVDDKCTISNTIPSLSTFTIEFFLNTAVVDGTQNIILDQNTSLRYEITTTNKFNIHLGNGNAWAFTTDSSNTVVVANRWYHTAWTWNGSSSIIYVNGISDASYSHSAASSGTGNIILGQYTFDNSYAWSGRIGSAKIYNRSLSASEVLQNYNAQKSRFGL